MGRSKPGIDRVARADRPSPLLTSRRHIDLLRVAGAARPLH
ncbi:putative leader peptide [Streptomyces macrosporus]